MLIDLLSVPSLIATIYFLWVQVNLRLLFFFVLSLRRKWNRLFLAPTRSRNPGKLVLVEPRWTGRFWDSRRGRPGPLRAVVVRPEVVAPVSPQRLRRLLRHQRRPHPGHCEAHLLNRWRFWCVDTQYILYHSFKSLSLTKAIWIYVYHSLYGVLIGTTHTSFAFIL